MKDCENAEVANFPADDNLNWKEFFNLELSYCSKLLALDLRKYAKCVEYTYNPLDYASDIHCAFLKRFLKKPVKVLFVGMNPGPYGMAQTGVPFGDVRSVINWMKIDGSVKIPSKQHPKKPVHGLKCVKNEVSGERFWGFFSQKMNLSPEEFFNHAFVVNICPLLFLDKSGKNVALSTLPAELRKKVELLCSGLLLKTIDLLRPRHIVAVGQYAYDKINRMLKNEFHTMATQSIESGAIVNRIIYEDNHYAISDGQEIAGSNMMAPTASFTTSPSTLAALSLPMSSSSLASSSPPISSLSSETTALSSSIVHNILKTISSSPNETPSVPPTTLTTLPTTSPSSSTMTTITTATSSPTNASSLALFTLPTSKVPLSIPTSTPITTLLTTTSSLTTTSTTIATTLLTSTSLTTTLLTTATSQTTISQTTISPTTSLTTTSTSSSSTSAIPPLSKPSLGLLMHPSPANPLANKGWHDIAWRQLTEMGVLKYFSD